ncbi:MAG: MATE family efflux transporter [Marinifilaceae bacterium]|jgi:MATE family multidrug resistance protein|nr:MATE family efflux transporter [Marinifilaceae bacterium]
MNKSILRLALPNIISNITVPLLGAVDIALMGHLGNVDFIGGIALAGTIFNFIYWSFAFLRMGTTGITAQSYGEKDRSEQINTLIRGLSIAILAGFLIILLQKPIELLSFYLFESEQNVENIARQYFYIRIWAAPATISLYALNGWFIGMQNAKIPMIVAICGNLINISLSFIFVYFFDMEAKGVALGTLITQYISCSIFVITVLRKHSDLLISITLNSLIRIDKLKKFMSINSDIFIRTFCIIIVFSFFTAESAGLNKDILAANTILLQFLFIFSYFMDGFAYAAEALVGKFYGAKEKNALNKLVRYLFIWGIGLSLLFTILYILGARNILSIFTNSNETIELAMTYIQWLYLLPILSFASFIFDGIYIGLTAAKLMRNTMIIACFGFFFPCFYLLKNILNNNALWIAMLSFMLARAVFQAIFYKKALNTNSL